MKKLILLVFLLISGQMLFAQSMGINTLTPDSSAALDIQSDHQGLLVPRVSLKTLNDSQTIPSPAHSLLIYNRNGNLPGGTGYYYNAGTNLAPEWKSLSGDKKSEVAFEVYGLLPGQNIPLNVPTRILFGSEDYDLNGNYDDGPSSHGSVFTAPTNGIYHFDVQVFCSPTGVGVLSLMRKRNGSLTALRVKKIGYDLQISTDVKLLANDEVFIAIEHNRNGGVSANAQFGESFFNGRLVIKQ